MVITIKGDDDYTWQETWEKVDDYCQNCGKKTVWEKPDSEDWDSGECDWLCTSCKVDGNGRHYNELEKGEDNFFVIKYLLDPSLPMPVHNPRPVDKNSLGYLLSQYYETAFLERFDKLMEPPKFSEGQSINYFRYMPLMKAD